MPATAEALRTRQISYSKARTLTRLATAQNEAELLSIATTTTAADLGRALAAWLHRNSDPEGLDARHQRQRSVKWRNEPDGMVTFSLRLPPLLAGLLISFLTKWIMTTSRHSTRSRSAQDRWPTVAQQHADALEHLLTDGSGQVDHEVVVHVTGDGNTLDDGVVRSALLSSCSLRSQHRHGPADSVVADLLPQSFISALIHDSAGNPIDATNRRRHPTRRQKRLVKARDRHCIDCGRADLLEYDHVPAFEQSGHTMSTELELRCAPCHQARHS